MPIYLNGISRSTQTKLLEQWTGWLSGVHREEEIWGRKIHCGRQWWYYWPVIEAPRQRKMLGPPGSMAVQGVVRCRTSSACPAALGICARTMNQVGELKEYVRGIKSALANTLRMKAIKDLVWLVGLYSERDMYVIWCANNFSARCWVHVLENRGRGVGH